MNDFPLVGSSYSQNEQDIWLAQNQLPAILAHTSVAISEISPDGKFIRVNDELCRILDRSRDELLKLGVVDVTHPDDVPNSLTSFKKVLETGEPVTVDKRYIRPNGEFVWADSRLTRITDERGQVAGVLAVTFDLTNRRETEEKLRRSEEQLALSQKLESVGRLAGGIAHDFNNMLTVILGYSDRTLRALEPGSPAHRNVEEIKRAGTRSAELTQQLLAFSRKQMMQIREVCLNQIVRETTGLLESLIGENIRLSTKFGNQFSIIAADPGQIAQVIINLAVNARDAMLNGGDLIIETANINLNAEASVELTFSNPGAYVKLTVVDTGIGIDDETKTHIFEPFYTTKEINKGTGLGLSTVYGVIKQLNGYIWVESKPGQGTTFSIYLPRVAQSASTEAPQKIGNLPTGNETILFVEDEAPVRKLVFETLVELGYQVIEAASGEEAVALTAVKNCRLDLLLTDVVMPGMSGRDLSEKIKEICPDVKVLFASGYMDDEILRHGITEDGANFIQKPFSPDELAQKIRSLLDDNS